MRDLPTLVLQLGASSARRFSADGVEERIRGPGGGLARALDSGGQATALQALLPGERLLLEDGPLLFGLERRSEEAVERVRWGSGPALEAVYAVPPATRKAAPAGMAEPLPVSQGSAGFRERYGVRAAYAAGPLAYGVSGPAMVSALAREHLLGFLGTTGLDLDTIRANMAALAALGPGLSAGVALPQHGEERRQQEEVLSMARLLDLRSALTWATAPPSPELVRFKVSGLSRGPDGQIRSRHRLFVALANLESAEPWMCPAPGELLDALLARGQITAAERALARRVPVADDLIAEGHAGGRTERWPLMALVPCLIRLRDRVASRERYDEGGVRTHIGAAGEIGDPWSMHAAFGLGADFVVTGTINATAAEAATSLRVKEMLAEAGVADCRTAPAADRFETGGRVQVLSRGSRFAQQAEHLYELYRRHRGVDDIPEGERRQVERTIFHRTLEEVWAEILQDLSARRPQEAQLAEEDPRHRMALIFRWYLDMSVRWGISGTPGRARDYQVWCGPAVGAFNDWVRGTWLEPLVARRVVTIADALLEGAAAVAREGLATAMGLASAAGDERSARPKLVSRAG